MLSWRRWLSLWLVGTVSVAAMAARYNPGTLNVEEMSIALPSEWKIFQETRQHNVIITNLEHDDGFVTFYMKGETGLNAQQMFQNEVTVLEAARMERLGSFDWTVVETQKDITSKAGTTTNYVTAFLTEVAGKSYYGVSTANTASAAKAAAMKFLSGASLRQRGMSTRSLTGPDFRGKKYYLGWGAAMSGDPAMMHNEVKYDVQHTHNVFTKDVGGNYIGVQIIGPQTSKKDIQKEWEVIANKMTAEDMYVQYSSGHGSKSGLAVGVTYNDIRDNALAYPGQEIIIFTMACYSGNLVNSFNAKKSVWESWKDQGRTLMVMGSSEAHDTSSTGPGKDPKEPGGPSGSAGSAYGHALWKALIGDSDGFVDGVKDGFLSLGEIEKFTISKTEKVGGHTPVVTGTYNPTLIMAKVPSREFLATLKGGTEGLSDEQIMQKIQELDRAMEKLN